jgi:hypothetical protein
LHYEEKVIEVCDCWPGENKDEGERAASTLVLSGDKITVL